MQRFLAFSERKKVKIVLNSVQIFFLAKINFKPSQRDKHLLLKFGHCYSSLQLKCKARFSPMILSIGSFITTTQFP